MEKSKEENIEKNMNKQTKLTIHHIFWYFIIFSILGLIIETVYCYIMSGVIESRKGLIWGPLCPVYGASGALLLLALDKYKNKNPIILFIYGFIVGSVAEYILSYGLEAIYGIRFWEYDYLKFNLNGRICLVFSIYWGLLSVVLVKLVRPIMDKFIDKMNIKIRNIIEIILFMFLLINCIFTVWGIQTYQNRVIHGKENINPTNFIEQIQYTVENKYFTNDRMSKTFPNLRFKDENGKEIWIKSMINEE